MRDSADYRRRYLTWPRGGVRLGESLWSVTHRFLWLNSPNLSDLIKTCDLSSLTPFSLIDGGLRSHLQFTSHLIQTIPESYQGFAEALHLSKAQWLAGTLGWLRIHHSDDILSEMRFCPECLRAGYHTVVFQLTCINHCPIHKLPLISGCPHCGKPVSPELCSATLHFPYGCTKCGQLIVSKSSLIDPAKIDGQAATEIIAWHRWLGSMPFLSAYPTATAASPGYFSPAWRHACIASLGKYAAPDSMCLPNTSRTHRAEALCKISLTRWETAAASRKLNGLDYLAELARSREASWIEGRTNPIDPLADTRYGLSRNHRIPGSHNSSVENSQYQAIYRAYRRHLQKSWLGKKHDLLQSFVDGSPSLWLPTSSTPERDRRAAAYALLLFRCKMENWPDVFCYNAPDFHSTPRPRKNLMPAGMPAYEFDQKGIYQPHSDWLQKHVFYENLRALFHKAFRLASAMAAIGQYKQCHEIDWGIHQPYAIALRRADRVTQFISWELCNKDQANTDIKQ